jgi:hypothetical protein
MFVWLFRCPIVCRSSMVIIAKLHSNKINWDTSFPIITWWIVIFKKYKLKRIQFVVKPAGKINSNQLLANIQVTRSVICRSDLRWLSSDLRPSTEQIDLVIAMLLSVWFTVRVPAMEIQACVDSSILDRSNLLRLRLNLRASHRACQKKVEK